MNIIKDFFKYSKRRVFNYAFKFLLAFALMYIGSLVMYIPKTYAEQAPTWYFDNTIVQPKNLNFIQWTAGANYHNVTASYVNMDSSHWFFRSNTLTIDPTWGASIALDSGQLLNINYMYYITFYTCTNMSYNFYYGLGTGNSNQEAINNASNYVTIRDAWLGTATDNVCHSVMAVFNPNVVNSRIVNLRIIGASGTQSGYLDLYGFNIQSLGNVAGLSAGDVQNIINNSGLATASSVNQVQTSVNQVKQEIAGMQDEQKKTNQTLKDMNDNINDSDTSGAQDSASSFFSDFTTDTHGLTSIITAPLSLISSITSSSCSPLVLPLPFVDKDLTLPCMSSIYKKYFGSFLTIYQIITFGIVAYWVCVRIFNLVKDFKNPDHDEIEVLDL